MGVLHEETANRSPIPGGDQGPGDRATDQPEVKGFYGKSSTAALSMAIGEDFTRFQKEEIERWKRIARIAGIQAV